MGRLEPGQFRKRAISLRHYRYATTPDRWRLTARPLTDGCSCPYGYLVRTMWVWGWPLSLAGQEQYRKDHSLQLTIQWFYQLKSELPEVLYRSFQFGSWLTNYKGCPHTHNANWFGRGGLVISGSTVGILAYNTPYQNCQLNASVLYQKKNLENNFSIWSERQSGGKPLSSHWGLFFIR